MSADEEAMERLRAAFRDLRGSAEQARFLNAASAVLAAYDATAGGTGERCWKCNQAVAITWWAPSDAWDQRHDGYCVLCPTCFDSLTAAAGHPVGWVPIPRAEFDAFVAAGTAKAIEDWKNLSEADRSAVEARAALRRPVAAGGATPDPAEPVWRCNVTSDEPCCPDDPHGWYSLDRPLAATGCGWDPEEGTTPR